MNRQIAPRVAGALSLALLLALAAGPGVAESTTFEWSGTLASGSTVEIKGVNGSIDAAPASGNEVEIEAVKKARRSDPDSVEIEVLEHADGITVCAVYPSRRGRQNVCEPGDGGRLSSTDNDTQVEFTVRIPAGLDLAAKTINGKIVARDLDGAVDAKTVNGSVRIATSGLARASTVNGSIEASIGSTDWSEPISFETVNGSLSVEMPAAVNADVRASSTNGRVRTDFPLEVPRTWHGGKARGTLGAGGSELELSTVNGSISINKG